jgi:hypothetical protein
MVINVYILPIQGYTSLGKTTDTRPNPALLNKRAEKAGSGSDGCEETFWPAFMLSDWALERAGRYVRTWMCVCVFVCVCLCVCVCVSVCVCVHPHV